MIDQTDRELELELMLCERHYTTGFGAIGPLTREQVEAEAAYERHMLEMEAEEEARIAAGGREICRKCGVRAVVSSDVCTLGYPGHPGAEFSVYRKCESCGHGEL